MSARAVRSKRSTAGRRPSVVLAVVLVALAAAIGVDPAAADVVVTVDPSSGLVDGQEVTISGTGAMPDSYVSAYVCAASDGGLCQYWVGGTDANGPTGDFAIDGRVRAQTWSSPGVPVDCRTEACEMVVEAIDFESGSSTELARVPLSFDPNVPLLDPPTATVDPAHDLVDGQMVRVKASGHWPQAPVRIRQCPAGEEARLGCRHVEVAFADDAGRVDQEVAVSSTLRGDAWSGVGRRDCRDLATPCELLVVSDWGSTAVPISFDPDSPVPPTPTIVVTPSAGIADGAAAEVAGEGFSPDNTVDLAFCAVSTDRCDVAASEYLVADADGAFMVEMELHHEIVDHSGFVDCQVGPGCEIRAIDWGAGEVARAPVSFAPVSRPMERFLDPLYRDVEVVRGVVYRRTTDVDGNDIELALDIYLPVGDTATERPAVMWMFGGWFMFGDREQLTTYAQDSARRGYVGIAIDYRIRPGMDLSNLLDAVADAEADARAAVEWLKAHAQEYRIDPDAIVAAGVSAGAVLAWNLAYGSNDASPGPAPVAAAVPISGMPMSGPETGAPPVIAFHAVDDAVLPIGPGRSTCPQAAAVGAVCQLMEMADGGHYIAESRSREIVGATYTFLAEHLLRPLGYFDPVPQAPVGRPMRPELYPPATDTSTTSTTPTSSSTAPSNTPPSTTPTSSSTTATPPSSTTTSPAPSTTVPVPTVPVQVGGLQGTALPARPVAAQPRFTG